MLRAGGDGVLGRACEPENNLLEDAAFNVAGSLAALWTPETSTDTFETLKFAWGWRNPQKVVDKVRDQLGRLLAPRPAPALPAPSSSGSISTTSPGTVTYAGW